MKFWTVEAITANRNSKLMKLAGQEKVVNMLSDQL